ncbi:MAG TPA: Mur ligase family protein [Thermoanaerobaculia bacterium]
MASRLPSSVPRLPALARLDALAPRGMKLGLAAIDAVCERLGRPEQTVPSVLVAGTNGKGSVAATMSAIAAAAGVRAGLYTSPHLTRVNERLRIAETDVSDEELDARLGPVFRAADAAPEVPLTYFEALTAAAFVAFAESRVELGIFEVGLGGRFDATNVAPAKLSVVTSIGLDHVEELGPTVESIAREKAGVFRSGRPALVGACVDGARRTLGEAARQTGAVLHDAARELTVSDVATSLDGTRFRLSTPLGRYELATPLPGAHQAANAALAARAAELFGEDLPAIPTRAIAPGVSRTRWPGRLERFTVAGRTVLLDGCHNAQAAQALADFLRDADLAGRAVLVFGAMADKDVESMAAILFPSVAAVRLVTASNPRAATAEELVARTSAARSDSVAASSLEAALDELLGRPGPDAPPIIVAGSLYLVGEAREQLLSGRFEDA